jgi:hypothetical protein
MGDCEQKLSAIATTAQDLEGQLFKSLLEARKQHWVEEQIIHLTRLGDFYLAKDLHKAACLFNGALALVLKIKQAPLIEDFLFNKLVKLQVDFYKSKGIPLLPADCKRLLKKHRQQLQETRAKCAQEFLNGKPTFSIQTKLTENFKSLLTYIIEENMGLMGKAPTKWSIIAMGSMARSEMCPYSDIECAVLLKKSSDETKLYFRTLFQLINMHIINLGETRFPLFESIDPIHSSATPSGFSMDIGGNTPLGVPGV